MSSLGCTWTAQSDASWLAVTAGATGSGNGAVSFSAAANNGSTSRTGTLQIGGQPFTVTQEGTSCSYGVAPLIKSMASAGGTATVDITTATGCAWSATTPAGWLTITSGSARTGTGAVTFTASTNSSSARTATITIAGQAVTVSQSGTTSCTISLTPTTRSVNLKKTTGTIVVTTAAGCPWTAASSAAWLTVTSAVTSQGTVSYTVARNMSGLSRTGTILVGGVTFTVTQRNDTLPNSPDGLRLVSGG
jgi:hypothetical protein